MLVPGLGPHRVVGELVPNQVELAADERDVPRSSEGPLWSVNPGSFAGRGRNAARRRGVNRTAHRLSPAAGHRAATPRAFSQFFLVGPTPLCFRYSLKPCV